MKSRIFGTIFLLLVLVGVYILTYDENQALPANSSQQSEPAFQPLKIN